ncbi:MAG: hypothetical protein R6W75_12635 [Smithellaceae bacterium]
MKKGSANNRILCVLILITILTGCGLKGNPVPGGVAVKKQIKQDLIAKASGSSVLLSWQVAPDVSIRYIDVEKSELGSVGDICRDCPRVFGKIGQLTVGNQTDFQFNDPDVQPGKVYSYRLKLCDDHDICSASSVVEIGLQ